MFFGIGAVISLVVSALFPGWWALFYQAPIGFGVAYIVAQQQAGESVDEKAIRTFAMLVGGGGAAWFLIMGLVITCLRLAMWGVGAWAIPSLLPLLFALAGMWVGVTMALDRYLETDLESSQRITGLICGPVWLAWLIVGAVIYILRAVV